MAEKRRELNVGSQLRVCHCQPSELLLSMG
uniref:Uncharacterized protein n=1 Tax=Anguilla anguilla TaxID=7936 RepID=A0A0E9QYU5_ANGAN